MWMPWILKTMPTSWAPGTRVCRWVLWGVCQQDSSNCSISFHCHRSWVGGDFKRMEEAELGMEHRPWLHHHRMQDEDRPLAKIAMGFDWLGGAWPRTGQRNRTKSHQYVWWWKESWCNDHIWAPSSTHCPVLEERLCRARWVIETFAWSICSRGWLGFWTKLSPFASMDRRTPTCPGCRTRNRSTLSLIFESFPNFNNYNLTIA